jgi:hypothetical protein
MLYYCLKNYYIETNLYLSVKSSSGNLETSYDLIKKKAIVTIVKNIGITKEGNPVDIVIHSRVLSNFVIKFV